MGRNLREEFPTVIDRAYKEYSKFQIVEEIMSKNVLTIEPEESMASAAKIMGDNHVGSLIVTIKGRAEAIITERDLLSKILAKGKDPKKVTVREVMSFPLITINPKSTIKTASKMMIENKGRLVAFYEGKLVGIITASDLIRTLPEVPETSLKVDDIMTKEVESSDENTTVRKIAKILGEKRIGSVIITRNKKPYGIFTERDLLTTFLAKERPLDTIVGSVASTPLITIPSGTSVHETAYKMASKHVRRLPVKKDDKIIGIVTARDLVEAYAK